MHTTTFGIIKHFLSNCFGFLTEKISEQNLIFGKTSVSIKNSEQVQLQNVYLKQVQSITVIFLEFSQIKKILKIEYGLGYMKSYQKRC